MQYYIYAYIRDDGTPYYIGKGQGNRAWDKHGYNYSNPPKDTSRIIILESGLTELGAFALERRLIRWHGRKDLGTGILRNRADGGEGGSAHKGCQHTQESKDKISKALKGRERSEEYKEARRRPHINKRKPYNKVSCPHCDKIGSEVIMKRWHFDRCKHQAT